MKDEEIDDSNLPDWVITTALPSGNSQARSVAVSCFTTAVLVRSKSASRSMVDSFRFIVFDQPPFWLGNKESTQDGGWAVPGTEDKHRPGDCSR